MLSPYHKSLAVTLCCCSFLIRSFATYFEPWIEMFSQYWPKFTHIFGAAVMLGSFAIRSPFLTPGYVLEDLELTVRLYKKAAPFANRARTSLVRNDLKILCDCAELGAAALNEVTRKGKVVSWNRIVTDAGKYAKASVGIKWGQRLTSRTLSFPRPCSHPCPAGHARDTIDKSHERDNPRSYEQKRGIRLQAIFG